MEINSNNITNYANQIDDYIDSLNDEYKKIYNSIQDLKNGWSGKKADLYYSYFEEKYLPQLKEAINLLNNYSTYLSKIPKAYETIDSSYANKEIRV